MAKRKKPQKIEKVTKPRGLENEGETRAESGNRLADYYIRYAAFAEKRFWPAVAVLVLIALALRIFILAQYLSENPFAAHPRVDAKVYWDWAGEIASGNLTQRVPFFSAPLYPYLIGLLRGLGAGLGAIYVFQILLDLSTAVLLGWTARRRFDAGTGLLAAALFLVLLEPVSFSLRVLTCSLQLLLLAVVWNRMLAVQREPSLRRHLMLGLALGLLCLSYPPALLLVFAAGIWLYLQSDRKKSDLTMAALTVLLSLAVISPATIHNYAASGNFFPIQAVPAVNLRQGNAPGAKGNYHPIPNTTFDREGLFEDIARQYRQARGKPGTWAEIDAHYRRKVFDYWLSDPLRTLVIAARKMYWFLTGRHYGDIYFPTLEMRYPFGTRLFFTSLALPWLIGPALIGLFWLGRRSLLRYAPEILQFSIPFVVVTVFWYSPRYRLPAIPIIVAVAAWAIVEGLRRLAEGKSRAVLSVFAAVSLFALLGPVNSSLGFDALDDVKRSWFEVTVGDLKEKDGDLEGAREHYRNGLSLLPNYARASGHLGRLALKEGRFDEAISHFRSAVRAQPLEADWHANLGSVLMRAGIFDTETVSSLEAALRIDPSLDRVRLDLGDAYARVGRVEEAQAQYGALLSNEALRPIALVKLAEVHFQLGQAEESIERYREALELQPANVGLRLRLLQILLGDERIGAAVETLRRGLEIRPDEFAFQVNLAWIHSVGPDSTFRNGSEALRLATMACEASEYRNPNALAVLAGAHAQLGNFEQAVRWIREAIRLAKEGEQDAILPKLNEYLGYYESGRPYP